MVRTFTALIVTVVALSSFAASAQDSKGGCVADQKGGCFGSLPNAEEEMARIAEMRAFAAATARCPFLDQVQVDQIKEDLKGKAPYRSHHWQQTVAAATIMKTMCTAGKAVRDAQQPK